MAPQKCWIMYADTPIDRDVLEDDFAPQSFAEFRRHLLVVHFHWTEKRVGLALGLRDHPAGDAAGAGGGIAAGIAGARLEIIRDCGHLSTLERPDAVNRAISAWLAA